MKSNNYNDLINGVLSGDEELFNNLLTTIKPMAHFYALSIAKDEYIAQEAVQLAFIKIYQNLRKLKKADAFEGWFKKIVRNETLNLLAKSNREINFTAFDQEEDNDFEYNITDERIENQPELNFDRLEKERMISEILSSLPDNQRTPIMMYFFEGLKIKEIADTLKVNENTIKTRLTAGKKNIKGKVEFIQKRDGIRLYSISPIGFFIWLLKGYAQDLSEPVVVSVGVSGTAIDAAVKAGKISSGLIKVLGTKVAVGILSAALAVLGIYGVLSVQDDTDNSDKVETIKTVQETSNKKTEEQLYSVTYLFESEDGSVLPDEVMAMLPDTIGGLKSGNSIYLFNYSSVESGENVYDFVGWNPSDNVIRESDVEFVGTWKRRKQINYIVSYEFRSENGEPLPDRIMQLLPESRRYRSGEIAYAPELPSYEIGNWSFLRWDKDSITMTDQNETILGIWTEEEEKEELENTETPTVSQAETNETISETEPESEPETYICTVTFYVDIGSGAEDGSGILPAEVMAYLPSNIAHQVLSMDEEPVLPSIQQGDIVAGWQVTEMWGWGNKETYDEKYNYFWKKIDE